MPLTLWDRERPTSSPASPTPTWMAPRWSPLPGRRLPPDCTRRATRWSTWCDCSSRSPSTERRFEPPRPSPRSYERPSRSRRPRSPGAASSSSRRTWRPTEILGQDPAYGSRAPRPRSPHRTRSPRPPASSRRPGRRSSWPATVSSAPGPQPTWCDSPRRLNIPVATTFMAKGVIPFSDPLWLGAVGLQSDDYISCGFQRADVIICVGYDIVEYHPHLWHRDDDRKIVNIRLLPGRGRRALHRRMRSHRRHRGGAARHSLPGPSATRGPRPTRI